MSATPTAVHHSQIAARRRGPHVSMFVRMLIRAAVLRRGRAASALFAMVVAAAVATAMMNLYVDVQAKLPVLSTYLGHVDPKSTYWYVSAPPELLALAGLRLQHALDVQP